jgi:hypothetical protein
MQNINPWDLFFLSLTHRRVGYLCIIGGIPRGELVDVGGLGWAISHSRWRAVWRTKQMAWMTAGHDHVGWQQKSSAESATGGHQQRRPVMEDLSWAADTGPQQLNLMGIMTNRLRVVDRDNDELHVNCSKQWDMAQSPWAMGIKRPR